MCVLVGLKKAKGFTRVYNTRKHLNTTPPIYGTMPFHLSTPYNICNLKDTQAAFELRKFELQNITFYTKLPPRCSNLLAYSQNSALSIN